MSGSNVDLQSSAALSATWRTWRPDWPMGRYVALAIATACLLIGALECSRPMIGKVGPLPLDFENPFKAFFFVVVALQVWCLLTPRMHVLVDCRWGVSLWQVMLIVGAIEWAVLAAIGIAAIDLRWQSEPLWNSPKPTHAATISFLLLVIAQVKTDPRAYVRGFMQRCDDLWRRWNWQTKTVAVFFGLQVVLLGSSVCAYWRHASAMFAYHAAALGNDLGPDHKPTSNFEYFCQRCRQEIPPDARVLYHGPNEGLILAYEIYPRRVFMLPAEQRYFFRNCWNIEPWCKGMAADPLDHYWQWDRPLPNVTPRQFIANHQISYVVTFDNENVSNNSIQKLR